MIINNYPTIKSQVTPSFKSYNADSSATGRSAGSSFYRDYPTLKESVRLLEQNFPDGADILIYAGSDGEEAISIYSMLKDPKKYNIYSIDPCKKAIKYAKKGKYTVKYFSADEFILKDNPDAIFEEPKALFNKCLIPIEEPNPFEGYQKLIENADSFEKQMEYLVQKSKYEIYKKMHSFEKRYRLKPEVAEKIQFIEGDIKDIDKFKTQKPVGAIFFRNALYHYTYNGGFQPDDKKIPPNINRKEMLNTLFASIEKKLAHKGIFVLGDILQEYIYEADDYTLPQYIIRGKNSNIVSYPLNIQALKDNGHFIEIYARDIIIDSYKDLRSILPDFPNKIPLIWQKIR